LSTEQKTSKRKNKPGAGAPSKWDPKYCDMIVDYFNRPPYTKKGRNLVQTDFPSLAGFCVSIGISRDTLHRWSKKYPELSDAIHKAKTFQENWLLTNGMSGRLNTSFALMGMKNLHGWADKVENKSTVEIDNLVFDDEDE